MLCDAPKDIIGTLLTDADVFAKLAAQRDRAAVFVISIGRGVSGLHRFDQVSRLVVFVGSCPKRRVGDLFEPVILIEGKFSSGAA